MVAFQENGGTILLPKVEIKVDSSLGFKVKVFSLYLVDDRRQRDRVVRVPDLKSGGHGIESCSDH